MESQNEQGSEPLDDLLDFFSQLSGLYSTLEKMGGDYQNRAIARYEDESRFIFVDTCRVHDGIKPIETAILHPDYGEHCVIVEAYDTIEDALVGHEKWVQTMTQPDLPAVIKKICNSTFFSGVWDMMTEDVHRRVDGIPVSEL